MGYRFTSRARIYLKPNGNVVRELPADSALNAYPPDKSTEYTVRDDGSVRFVQDDAPVCAHLFRGGVPLKSTRAGLLATITDEHNRTVREAYGD